MNRPTVCLLAAIAFLMPLAVVAYQHRDEIRKQAMLEPWQGRLLYFTSPT